MFRLSPYWRKIKGEWIKMHDLEWWDWRPTPKNYYLITIRHCCLVIAFTALMLPLIFTFPYPVLNGSAGMLLAMLLLMKY